MEENNIIFEKISKVNGDVHIREYVKGKLLGKGGFAKCFEFTNSETKKILAAKIIPKSSLVKSRSKQKLIQEIKIHKSLHNQNIVQFEHVFEDSENVYILLELCQNQTLNELIKRRKRLHELEVQCYVVQIIQAIKYLHSNRVIHRDLKLGNLFLNNNLEVKLGDFGLATRLEFDEERKRTICGTPNYIAPEILDDKQGHSYPVDIWSIGVIIYTLIIGKPPFETPEVKTTYKKIKQNDYCFPENAQISDNAKHLIQSILKLNPSERPGIQQILEHPFLTSNIIPKNLPLSTLACPPQSTYLKQYLSNQTAQNNMSRQISTQRIMAQTQSSNNNHFESVNKNIPSNTDRMMGQTKGFENGNFLNTQSQQFDQNQQQVQQQLINSASEKDRNALYSQKLQSNMNFPNIEGNKQTASQQFGTGIDAGNDVGIWVSQWVDYSQKYGLGYLLNNGCSGVFFNDSTKIITDPAGQQLFFYERRQQDKIDILSQYSFNNYPDELKKKATLLIHFRNYLLGQDKKGNEQNDKNNQLIQQQQKQFDLSNKLIYVKKWMKTNHAIMFRLSNKVVQVNFTDKTEIHLSSEQKIVGYLNKKGERIVYPLSTALESNDSEMSKRLRYTKEILTHIYNSQSKTKVPKDSQAQLEI